MASIDDFRQLDSWRQSRDLVRRIYQVTSRSPFISDFSLRDQIRRASISMMSNIAEGFERGGNAEFRQFLAISKGSAAEVESQLLLALDLGFLEQKECDELISGLRQLRMLTAGLIRYLKACGMKGYRYIEPTKNR